MNKTTSETLFVCLQNNCIYAPTDIIKAFKYQAFFFGRILGGISIKKERNLFIAFSKANATVPPTSADFRNCARAISPHTPDSVDKYVQVVYNMFIPTYS